MKKNVFILVGNYGSGKTEIALHLSIKGAKRGERAVIVDLDIVNPFFRSGYYRELLEREKIRLIAAKVTPEASDVPVVVPDVLAAFDSDFGTVVFDVGGNPVGATALGQYQRKFCLVPPENLHMLFVVNICRPLTSNAQDIMEMLDSISATSRLSVTGLINNTNLGAESSLALLYEGDAVLKEVSQKTGIPVTYCAVSHELAQSQNFNSLSELSGELMLLELYTTLDWDDCWPQMTGFSAL